MNSGHSFFSHTISSLPYSLNFLYYFAFLLLCNLFNPSSLSQMSFREEDSSVPPRRIFSRTFLRIFSPSLSVFPCFISRFCILFRRFYFSLTTFIWLTSLCWKFVVPSRSVQSSISLDLLFFYWLTNFQHVSFSQLAFFSLLKSIDLSIQAARCGTFPHVLSPFFSLHTFSISIRIFYALK